MSYTSAMTIPRNYAQAKHVFDERKFKERNWRAIGNNTEVVELWGGDAPPAYGIKLHSTVIITYYADGRVQMDNFDSTTTNDRRNRAGKPLIRSIRSMTGKAMARVVQGRRWDVPDAPYGIPADVCLQLDCDGRVANLGEMAEEIWVPREQDQKERKALLRWARKHLMPVVNSIQSLEAFPSGGATWSFSPMDLEGLREAYEVANTDDQRRQEIASFIDRELTITPYKWARGCAAVETLDIQLTRFTPSAQLNYGSATELWDKKVVPTVDLPKYLD